VNVSLYISFHYLLAHCFAYKTPRFQNITHYELCPKSQPFYQRYKSMLQTSLNHINLINQRLITLETWCGIGTVSAWIMVLSYRDKYHYLDFSMKATYSIMGPKSHPYGQDLTVSLIKSIQQINRTEVQMANRRRSYSPVPISQCHRVWIASQPYHFRGV